MSEESKEFTSADLTESSIRPSHAFDLNEHRQGTVPHNHRFSVNKVQEGLQNIDPIEWKSKVEIPQNDDFSYPSNMLLAELHRQCQYIQPDKEFIEKSAFDECKCCNKKLNKKHINLWTYDVYKQFANDYGVTLPLYFTFIKMHLMVMIFQFLSFGLFFIIHSKMICNHIPDLLCDDPHYDLCNACEFVGFYGFIDQKNFTEQIQLNRTNSIIYQSLAFLIFLINISMPMLHDIVLTYHRIRYWDMENSNIIKEHKLSVYVKHLPHKMTQDEVQKAIERALVGDEILKSQLHLFENTNAISELVYIYDIHEITTVNERRIELFLNILLISQQLTELDQEGKIKTLTQDQAKNKNLVLTSEGLRGEFRAKIQELMNETGKVKSYIKNGLPFTNKVIIKFRTREQRDAVYFHYQKSVWENMKIRIKVLKRQVEEMKLRKKVKDFDVESDDMSSRAESFIIESSVPELSSEQTSETSLNQPLTQTLNGTMLLQIQNNYENDNHDHKELRIYRGFKEQEIYWQNIGMNTLTRFLLRVRSLVITIVACGFMMLLFELMYVYQNNPEFKKSKTEGNLTVYQKVLADFFTIMVTVVSSVATLVLLNQTVKSKRSTYTQQEKNIVSFILFIQLILITAFPFVMSLEFWHGQTSLVPIYDLISLVKNRMLFKMLFHTFHIRHTTFWCKKRKVIKNFSPYLYFQGQLNQIMTPPKFPQRGRLFTLFFIYTTGICMVYLCPMIMILCIACDIYLYFYDKRVTLRNYTIDQTFNIKHMQYQMIVAPLTMYLYIKIFWWSKLCVYVGTSVCIVLTIVHLFFRHRIVKFVVIKILRPRKIKTGKKFQTKSFMQSYLDYFESLKIEKLTTLLATMFKQVQSQYRDSKL